MGQTLEKTGEWRTHRFVHVPTAGGPWKLCVQLNGWGNFGHDVRISIDDVTRAPAKEAFRPVLRNVTRGSFM